VKRKRQRNCAVLALVFDFGVEMPEQANLALVAETNHVAARELLGRFDQRLPARGIQPLDQCRLDFRFRLPADAPPPKLGRDDLGVVNDKLIAGLEPLRQIRHDAVVQGSTGLDDEHSRGIAWASGTQRDPLSGQFEVEEIGAHGVCLARPSW
jgi:hypothetical protein